MRSDYIGQCAAFRGLPEYIGFSQFFVPRLNRTQLQQVIEEPATLSGNKITRRLTERLIHDITEGVDQLPILQHALNQIWHAADNGKEEMDLIHYAKVGGMPVNELPDEHVDTFNKWFEDLSPKIKACYNEPNLQNVLDTHTNKLYEQAAAYYNGKAGKNIPDDEAKVIIKTAFICLTKIDQSRAVRNRMTLKEITNILGRPEIGAKEVGTVLNIFREPGNTFIRPFLKDDSSNQYLNEDDVLDITHESLIRNWEYLGQWAKEEFNNYTISLDFEQQLNRWVASGKSNDFLLPIGPLTYFENWFKATKPNLHWIARYLPEEIEQDKKLSKAKQVLNNAQEFLKRSARKHVVTRTIIRYGAKRIAVVLAIIAVITLSSFALRDYFRRQNDFVLKSIKEQTFEIANKSKLSLEFPVPVITQELILGNTTIPEVIDAIKDQDQKIKIATGIATQLVTQGRNEPKKEILQSLSTADSLLEQIPFTQDGNDLSKGLKLMHDYAVTAEIAYYLNPDKTFESFVIHNAKRSAKWALQVLKQQPEGFNDIQSLSLAIEEAINHKVFTKEEVNQLLEILSPFANAKRTSWLLKNYQNDKVQERGSLNYGFSFNGLYQDLAYLYAAAGKPAMALQCVDTLLHYPGNYYQNDYATVVENASSIAVVFYTYGNTADLGEFVRGYCMRKNIGPEEFYKRLVSQTLVDFEIRASTNFYTGGGGRTVLNLNLRLMNDSMLSYFFAKLKDEIFKIGDAAERNFEMAETLKNEGILFSYHKEVRGDNKTDTKQYFKDAIDYYKLVPKEYLEQPLSVIGSTGNDMVTMPRKFLFLYPDYRVPFHTSEPRAPIQFYNSPAFIKYVMDQDLFDNLYNNPDEFKYFELWLLDYQVDMALRILFFQVPMSDTIMEQLATKLESKKANQYADLNILYLHLAVDAFDHNQKDRAIHYIQQIQPDKLLNSFQYKLFDFTNDYSFELVGKVVAGLVLNKRFDLAYTLLNVFKKEVNRSSLYGYASQQISLHHQSRETAMQLVDSAKAEMNHIQNPSVFQPNRCQVAMALMYIDPEKYPDEAYRIIRNSSDKFQAIQYFSKAYAFHDKLYKGEQQAPTLASTGDKARFFYNIIEGYNLTKPERDEWKQFNDNEPFFSQRYLYYINENE